MSNRSILHGVGLCAGLGLCLGLAGQARAGGESSYGHAEITLGFPHGEITVGKTWDSDPREVVVDEDRQYDEDGNVIVEESAPPSDQRVVVVERYREPEYCDRVHVVRRVYVDPYRPRRDVIVYRRPERVVYAPSRCDRGEVHIRDYGHGEGHGRDGDHGRGRDSDHGGGGSYHRGDDGSHGGPRNLFPDQGGRPMRQEGLRPPRGVQQSVAVGGHSH